MVLYERCLTYTIEPFVASAEPFMVCGNKQNKFPVIQKIQFLYRKMQDEKIRSGTFEYEK